MKEKRYCKSCNAELIARFKIKFCSNKCQMDYQHYQWVESWKKGDVHGNIGILCRGFSSHLKRYLVEKYGNRCCVCGWNKEHPLTGVIPLEVDHIDGDSENCVEDNLRLICPNCHALTPFYKNLNKGRGRQWRMKKYIKN